MTRRRAIRGSSLPLVPTSLRRLLAVVMLSLPGSARGASYYFSQAGSDTLGNGTLANPWKSIAKFNQLQLRPGDHAYFRAGDQFAGRLHLDANDGGLNAQGQLVSPVKISSYGATGATTRARILAPFNSEGFLAFDTGGIELSHLDFVSSGFTGGTNDASRKNGIDFLNDQTKTSGRAHLNHIRVHNVSAHGFGLNGVRVWSHNTLGYNDVHIADSEFSGNGYAGVYVGSTRWHHQQHANVTVDRVVSHNNPGFQSASMPYTGHGIIIAETNGGFIQNSVAYDNGKQHGNANVAMWTYQSNAITIQGNLAFGNRSVGPYDGGGFDIDGGTTNSIIQYNRSYDNDGAGLLLAQFEGAMPMANNVFRYNLSVNDGKGLFGGISVSGARAGNVAKDAVFHNNTIVVDKSAAPHAKGAVWFVNAHHDDIAFLNNAFIALDGATLIAGDTSASRSTFAGNAYWTAGGKIILEDQTYNSVLSWANASGQEKVGGQFVAVTSDPKFSDMETLQLRSTSPLLNAALLPGSNPWPSWLNSLGTRDLGGVALNQAGRPGIGAREFLFADLDGNGRIDGGDLAVWRSAFGATGAAAYRADLDGNGQVDGSDYLAWQRLAFAFAHAPAAATAVPEPSRLAITAPALLLAVRRRR
jgi:hypothetical protein